MLYDKCYIPKYNKVYRSNQILNYIRENGIPNDYRGYFKCPYCHIADFKVCLNVKDGKHPYLSKWPNSHHSDECYYNELETGTTKVKNNNISNLTYKQTQQFVDFLLNLLESNQTKEDLTLYIDQHDQVSPTSKTNEGDNVKLIERKSLRRKKISDNFYNYMVQLLSYSSEPKINIGVYGNVKIIKIDAYNNGNYKYHNYKILNKNGKFVMNLGVLDNKYFKNAISLIDKYCNRMIKISMIVELELKNRKFLNAKLLKSNSIKVSL